MCGEDVGVARCEIRIVGRVGVRGRPGLFDGHIGSCHLSTHLALRSHEHKETNLCISTEMFRSGGIGGGYPCAIGTRVLWHNPITNMPL